MAKQYTYSGKDLNYTSFGLTLRATSRGPIVANEQWATKADAEEFIKSNASDASAYNGMIISVVNDGSNNGVYYVSGITSTSASGALLNRVGSSSVGDLTNLVDKLNRVLSDDADDSDYYDLETVKNKIDVIEEESKDKEYVTAVALNDLNDRLSKLNLNDENLRIKKLSSSEIASLPDASVIQDAYVLISTRDGRVDASSEIIKIYKDSSLTNVSLNAVKLDFDEYDSDDEFGYKQILTFEYTLADGTSKKVDVDMSKLLSEAELKASISNGLAINDGKIVIKNNDSDHITVNGDGIKLNVANTKESITTGSKNLVEAGAIKSYVDAKVLASSGAGGELLAGALEDLDYDDSDNPHMFVSGVDQTDGLITPSKRNLDLNALLMSGNSANSTSQAFKTRAKVGNLDANTTIPAGWTLNDLIKAILVGETKNPTLKSAPTVTLSGFTTETVEVGSTVGGGQLSGYIEPAKVNTYYGLTSGKYTSSELTNGENISIETKEVPFGSRTLSTIGTNTFTVTKNINGNSDTSTLLSAGTMNQTTLPNNGDSVSVSGTIYYDGKSGTFLDSNGGDKTVSYAGGNKTTDTYKKTAKYKIWAGFASNTFATATISNDTQFASLKSSLSEKWYDAEIVSGKSVKESQFENGNKYFYVVIPSTMKFYASQMGAESQISSSNTSTFTHVNNGYSYVYTIYYLGAKGDYTNLRIS